MHHLRTLAATAATAAIVAIAAPAAAQDYPTKDIRLVVPWGAGGGTDGISRKVSAIAEKELGQTIYVENVEGGMSANGIMNVMSARPDGYTIGVLTYDSVITVPYQQLLPGYELDKLQMIGRLTNESDAIIVADDAPYQTIDDLIAAAKEAPGDVKVAIQNTGSRTHLAMLELEKIAGIDLDLIPYPGGAGPQKEAMLSGEVVIAVTSLGDFANLLDEGDARGLVEFSDAPNPTFSDVPDAKSAGLDLRSGSFIIVAAPAKTPDDVVAKLAEAYQQALEGEEFQEWVSKVGVTPGWLGPQEVTDWVAEQQEAVFAQFDKLKADGVIAQ